MRAVLEYEKNQDFSPERQPHFNPGFDVISKKVDGSEERFIEVKGLQGDWTDRGVKLSRTQIINAQEYGDAYWLYVVENATNQSLRKIHAIKNPFLRQMNFGLIKVGRL